MQQGINNTQPDEGQMQRSSMRSSHEHMMRGGRERTTVADAQRELKAQGLYNGRIDGKEGRQMKSALSQFQEQNGLKKTAQLDRETRSKLNQTGNGGGQQQPMTGTSQPQPQIPPSNSNMQPQSPTGTTTR
jgi:peptidoglycan hydrolase-like protein with peptidoglycan-binding domain